MFEVGKQVVCLTNFKPDGREHVTSRWPQKGDVFTIRKIVDYTNDHPGGAVCLCFEEIVCSIHPKFGKEYAFKKCHFRPVKETDISIFTEMLAPVKHDDRVNV